MPSSGPRRSRRLASHAGGLGAPSGNPAPVREESHLDEMRSAIRGDFERLAERRGEQDLMRVEAEAQVPEPPVDAPPLEAEDAPPRSWFARFVSP